MPIQMPVSPGSLPCGLWMELVGFEFTGVNLELLPRLCLGSGEKWYQLQEILRERVRVCTEQ